jgi:hypothetical protein
MWRISNLKKRVKDLTSAENQKKPPKTKVSGGQF